VRKLVSVSLLGAGMLAGSVGYRRRSARRVERIDLYAADGTFASLDPELGECDRLLALARDLLSLAQ